eukprot:UN0920
MALFLRYGFAGQVLCKLLGLVYPSFESFKAVERAEPEAMKFWLMYWVVAAALATCEYVLSDVPVRMPFYYQLKLALLVWLCHPYTRGASYVYRWAILPVLCKNQESIDSALEESGGCMRRCTSGALSMVIGVKFGSVLQ